MTGIFDWLKKAIAEQEAADSFHPARVSELPDPLRHVMARVLRLGQVDAGELARDLSQGEADVEDALQSLVHLGFLKQVGYERPYQYAAALGLRRARQMPAGIWQSLNQEITSSGT
ncbi:MAG: hypothetical protein AB1791_01200 [Chloroflexota bacterium]